MYKIVGGFDRELAFKNGHLLVDNAIKIVKWVFSIYHKPIDVPNHIDYGCGILIRNMMIWCIFRYTHPEDISIDYLDLLMTQDGQAFTQSFICPCGGTI